MKWTCKCCYLCSNTFNNFTRYPDLGLEHPITLTSPIDDFIPSLITISRHFYSESNLVSHYLLLSALINSIVEEMDASACSQSRTKVEKIEEEDEPEALAS